MTDITTPAVLTVSIIILLIAFRNCSVLESVSLCIVALCSGLLFPNIPSNDVPLFKTPPAKGVTETQCYRDNTTLNQLLKRAKTSR